MKATSWVCDIGNLSRAKIIIYVSELRPFALGPGRRPPFLSFPGGSSPRSFARQSACREEGGQLKAHSTESDDGEAESLRVEEIKRAGTKRRDAWEKGNAKREG